MNPRAEGPAFEAGLVDLYPQLLRFAERLSGSRADAHDLVQDAMERGLRRRGLFRSGGTPDRWMTTILRRIFVDRCRSARRLAELHGLWAVDAEGAADPPPPASASEAFDAADLRLAVGLLDAQFREVYVLFAFDHLSQREIARRLAMPTATVGTRLMRARQRLRVILERCQRRANSPRPAPSPPTGRGPEGAAAIVPSYAALRRAEATQQGAY